MTEIVFLGCGGGRVQTVDQTFRTGGFRIHDEFKVHVDPGPGALLLTNQYGLDPADLDIVFVSHSHTDHYTDAEVLLEALSRNESSSGRYIGSQSSVVGKDSIGPAISEYHKEKVEEVISLESGESFEKGNFRIVATRTEHGDPTAIGFKAFTEGGVIGFTSDTGYFDDLPELFKDARVLIANVTRPDGKRIDGHLCSNDLIKILKKTNPELAVISHMGMLFLRNTPSKQASHIEENSGVKTIPGFAGTKISMDDELRIKSKAEQVKLNNFS